MNVVQTLRKFLIVAPLILFFLGVSGIFNIFNMDEYIQGDFVEIKKNDRGDSVEDNLIADTRSLLYVEVLQTAVKYDSWLIGRSPARGNETALFASIEEISGRKERLANEVAILNIFTWSGVIGVVLYLFIFYKASNLAINNSNNIYSKLLGLFIAFRWLYAWVEDINNFALSNYFIWFMIGLCLSKEFRSMSDSELKAWIRGIFGNNRNVKIRLKFNEVQ